MLDHLPIDPNGIYYDGTLVLALDLTHAALNRARRSGQLRFTRQGRRILYRGKWIIDWLEQSAQVGRKGAAEEAQA